jgi:hypothetical protein
MRVIQVNSRPYASTGNEWITNDLRLLVLSYFQLLLIRGGRCIILIYINEHRQVITRHKIPLQNT